ncbi:MAG: hypothetical protein ACYTBJ_01730 [Planctomycetota bacterium]|jgi:hypothetical protein
MIIAIDPGSEKSAWLIYRSPHIKSGVEPGGIVPNEDLLTLLRSWQPSCQLAIESVSCYGKPVGESVFSTCMWIGRFVEAWGGSFTLIPRQVVKKYICPGVRNAGDKQIRTALISRLGSPGTKKKPGPTYGVKSHLWAALAVAVTCAEMRK